MNRPKAKDRLSAPKTLKRFGEIPVKKLPRYKGLYKGVKKSIDHFEKYHKGEKVL